jgi:hypothetical protein
LGTVGIENATSNGREIAGAKVELPTANRAKTSLQPILLPSRNNVDTPARYYVVVSSTNERRASIHANRVVAPAADGGVCGTTSNVVVVPSHDSMLPNLRWSFGHRCQ